MLLTPAHLRPFSAVKFLSPPRPAPFHFPLSPRFPIRPTDLNSRRASHKAWAAQLSEEPTASAITAAPPPDGPIELPPSTSPIFSTSDDSTPLQAAASVLLTGAITVFLFRSIRRRAKRVKETRFRSSGEKKSSLAEEAMESLKSVTLSPAAGARSPPSPAQALLGALTAGVIALVLFKFATTVESSLNRQTISDNYSVRQITITIRTIINGLCYLATFVFGINAVGLFLYSGQLAFNSFLEEDSGSESQNQKSQSSSTSSADSKPGDDDTNRATEDQSPGSTQG